MKDNCYYFGWLRCNVASDIKWYCDETGGECPNDPSCPKWKSEKEYLAKLMRTQPITVIPDKDTSDVEVIERPPYCKFCFNARVYQPTEDDLLTGNTLDDTNDSSSIVVGENMRPYRSIMINSGNGEPLNIEFLEWAVTRDRWETVGKYYPKFCPECGRRLDEYEKNNCD